MKNFKGKPLEFTFRHIDNDDFHKTIATAKVTEINIPEILRVRFFNMFGFDPYSYFTEGFTTPTLSISCQTVCKSGDAFDPEIGEKIARKKVMKRFMSMIRQVADAERKDLISVADECFDIAVFADDCRNRIIDYIRNQ